MERRTLLKTGIAGMVAGLFPKYSFATPEPLMTVRFTETSTGTKWLIKYLDGVGYKAFTKKRFLFKEEPFKIKSVYSKMNYINWDKRNDPESINGGQVTIWKKSDYLDKLLNVKADKIECDGLTVEYSESWLKMNWDQRTAHVCKTLYGT